MCQYKAPDCAAECRVLYLTAPHHSARSAGSPQARSLAAPVLLCCYRPRNETCLHATGGPPARLTSRHSGPSAPSPWAARAARGAIATAAAASTTGHGPGHGPGRGTAATGTGTASATATGMQAGETGTETGTGGETGAGAGLSPGGSVGKSMRCMADECGQLARCTLCRLPSPGHSLPRTGGAEARLASVPASLHPARAATAQPASAACCPGRPLLPAASCPERAAAAG